MPTFDITSSKSKHKGPATNLYFPKSVLVKDRSVIGWKVSTRVGSPGTGPHGRPGDALTATTLRRIPFVYPVKAEQLPY
jgi:hypothetical protein